jgi:hypothetical protein
MNLTAFRWLIRDVFLKARSSGFSALLFSSSIITAMACLTIRPNPETGILSIGWGRWPIANTSGHEAGANILFWIAFGVADVIGVLIALMATAGFLPTFLEPASAKSVLCKSASRSTLLAGRCLGVVAFLALHAGIFVVLTGVAFGIATNIWMPGYWLAWPLLVVHFLPFYAFSALIAVSTRNTAAAMLGSAFFWVVSWGMNFGRHYLAGASVDGATQDFSRAVEFGYQVLPKPADFSLILYDALGAHPDGLAGFGLRSVQQLGLYSPLWSVASSLVVAVMLFVLACYELHNQEY